MQSLSDNSWLSKSPLKSFNVWLKDQNRDSATLVVSSGAVYRKQAILSLEEIKKEGAPPPPEGEEAETVTKLRIDYAAQTKVADIRLGGDEGDGYLITDFATAQIGFHNHAVFIRRAKARCALYCADHDRAGILHEILPLLRR